MCLTSGLRAIIDVMNRLHLCILACSCCLQVRAQSNVQTYTPSVLLQSGQTEISLFNNFYTQEGYRDGEGKFVDAGEQQTYFTGITQLNYGVSKQGRFNIGLDLNLQSVRLDPNQDASFIQVLSFADTTFTRTAMTNIGPRIKWKPFQNVQGFSLSSAFWIPLADSMENYPFLAWDRYTWWNQFFYDQKLGENTRLFAEADLLFRFPRYDNQSTLFSLPTSLFLSWFPTDKSTVYGMAQFSPEFIRLPDPPVDGTAQLYYNSYFLQSGVGAKYQILTNIQLEFLYTNFIASENAGAGATWNLGIKYIR
jgi:hypothetical protein